VPFVTKIGSYYCLPTVSLHFHSQFSGISRLCSSYAFKNCLQPPTAFMLLCNVDAAVPRLLPLTIPIHQSDSFMVEEVARKNSK